MLKISYWLLVSANNNTYALSVTGLLAKYLIMAMFHISASLVCSIDICEHECALCI